MSSSSSSLLIESSFYDLTITEFNNSLIENADKISMKDYFNMIKNILFPDLDLSFVEFFQELCLNKGKFCVSSDKLVEYGVLIDHKGVIDQCIMFTRKFEENIDYISERKQSYACNGKKTRYFTEYFLTPFAFKECLMRSKNETKYCKYYILLEMVYVYYKDYIEEVTKLEMKYVIDLLTKHNILQENIIIEKDKALYYADRIRDIHQDLTDVSIRSINKISDPKKIDKLVLIKDNINTKIYKTIRGQSSYINNVLRKMSPYYSVVLMLYCPNPIVAYNVVKERISQMKKEKIMCKSCSIILGTDTHENELTEIFKDVDGERFQEVGKYNV